MAEGSGYHWKVTDHVCHRCLGRVLERITPDGIVVARCSDCGLEAEGGHRAICTCGMTLRTGQPAGFFCSRNENFEPGATQEIVGLYEDAVSGV